MNTTRKQEKGGVLLELTIFIFLVALLTAASIRMHRSFHGRFTRIVQERNEGIRKARQAPELLPFGG